MSYHEPNPNTRDAQGAITRADLEAARDRVMSAAFPMDVRPVALASPDRAALRRVRELAARHHIDLPTGLTAALSVAVAVDEGVAEGRR